MALLLPALFAALALALLITGLGMLWRRVRARLAGRALIGQIQRWEVIRQDKSPNALGPTKARFIPHVAYTAADGSRHTAKVAEQFGRQYRNKHPEGSAFGVHPDPRNPAVAYANRWSDLVLPVLLMVVGVFILLPALGLVYNAVVAWEG